MKKIKYTPDAADKLREFKKAISHQYGTNKTKEIIKAIPLHKKLLNIGMNKTED